MVLFFGGGDLRVVNLILIVIESMILDTTIVDSG